ncbi:plasminogen receptor (KT)-like [Haliotis rubra]|uniref:plasminogen receptor (KT)-like n=1 Tax=Haliotis rubra TaxID=36100 RepID=UPI001EE52ACC|nr:plasminogen receptor (KT)-like [Haliotis rubra]XP_046578711.1 plasminogen receptor (KT)-like [Haliotis rubra]XP_046578717.1 plasminogen receptor (KT)-like [Haliotis rubra]
MGILLGKTMDENLKKQQEFMLKTSVIQMERQIQMQNQMRERMMAMQIARARDIFAWFGSFYALASLGMIAGFSKQRKPAALAPALPLTFLLAYQYDLAYGNKMNRMRGEADRIMDTEGIMLALPHGLPTLSSIEAARLDQDTKDRPS